MLPLEDSGGLPDSLRSPRTQWTGPARSAAGQTWTGAPLEANHVDAASTEGFPGVALWALLVLPPSRRRPAPSTSTRLDQNGQSDGYTDP
jgi:hypothetical protein